MNHERSYSSINDEPYIQVQTEWGTLGYRYSDWPDDDTTLVVSLVSLSKAPTQMLRDVEQHLEEQGFEVL